MMNRSTARHSIVVVALAALVAFGSPTPVAAAGLASLPGWNSLASAWAWLADLGGLTYLRGEQGSYIDPNGGHLVAPPNGSTTSHRLTHLRGTLGAYIDPNGKPQGSQPSGDAGGYLDPNGKN